MEVKGETHAKQNYIYDSFPRWPKTTVTISSSRSFPQKNDPPLQLKISMAKCHYFAFVILIQKNKGPS